MAGTTYDWLTHSYIVVNFKLDVVAQTRDAVNESDRFYWSEANAAWTFNGLGSVTVDTSNPQPNLMPPATWTSDYSDARTVVPDGWTTTTLPTSVPVVGPRLNDYLRGSVGYSQVTMP